jgi:hypothetical protein
MPNWDGSEPELPSLQTVEATPSEPAGAPGGVGGAPPPPVPPEAPRQRSPNRKEKPQTGILTDMLYLDNRYPVLLAGAAESGKSTIIISLIHAAARAGRAKDHPIDVSISSKFFRKGRDHAQQKEQEKDSASIAKIDAMQDYADLFYQNSRIDFVQARTELEATQATVPIVIPLDLTFSDPDIEVRLAIIDGRGELYEPQTGTGEKRYRELDPDIQNLLEQYQRAMSFVWVAPVFEEDDLNLARRCDQGLEAVLSRYQSCRPADSCKLDSHLMLLSKWDAVEPADNGRHFEQLEGKMVIQYFDELYRLSWDKFRNLPIGANSEFRRKFMQFCAWNFLNGRPIPLEAEFEDAFLRYPRTVLNWLISNALKLEARRGGELEETLQFTPFPDVMPPNTHYVPLSSRFIRALT